jgi:gamma-glutamyltranspeptidase/glutathione hydrolase
MSPTLVEKDGRVLLVLGSPSGSRIVTTVLETILNIVDFGMPPQWLPDEVAYERSGLMPDTIAALGGYKLVEQRPWGRSSRS